MNWNLDEDQSELYLEVDVRLVFKEVTSKYLRKRIVEGGRRSDGRNPREIRPINSQCGLLPQAHGSVLFTRGETQVNEKGQLHLSRRALLPDDEPDKSSTKQQTISSIDARSPKGGPSRGMLSKPAVDKPVKFQPYVSKDRSRKNNKSIIGTSSKDEAGTVNGEAKIR